jgi:acetoin utilization deacetylase AcuC-like enzyme
MLVVCSDDHRAHAPSHELFNGEWMAPSESPDRVDSILAELANVRLGPIIEPVDHGLEPLQRVHHPRFLRYLETAWAEWSALGRSSDVLPCIFPPHGRRGREPDRIDGKAGYFSFDTCAPLCAGTWQAVRSAADCALTAQKNLAPEKRGVFALCRPPGHHAGSDFLGGYCYVNNAAVAAQAFIDSGAGRVAILDIDYHHGNGTQEIFYQRSDVLFVSIHAHPQDEYPYFSGNADEAGEGDGEGFTCNFPLRPGAQYAPDWAPALHEACRRVSAFAPDALVVSLGVDTYEGDPISRFRLATPDFISLGETIGRLGHLTLFVMEGGYAVGQLGVNVVNVLRGFEQASR